MVDDVAIVGGGPAGAYLAYLLAGNGIHATIYDHSHPREKPCGGGVSPFARRKFPILEGVPDSHRFVHKMMFISPEGREAVATGQAVMNVSREHLDRYLLEKALESGVKLREERVIDLREEDGHWTVGTQNGQHHARLVVGADGVNSVVRTRILGRIPKENVAACVGYFVRGVERDYSVMKFLKGCNGYAWIFPRDTHSSIGVGTDLAHARDLSGYLDAFVEEYCPDVEKISRFGALIPAARDPAFYDIPCSGRNWIIIGDAAGHVDPLLGEGIRYAMWAAELAAEAITEGNPARFDVLWRNEYYEDLVAACKLVKLFYKPSSLELSVMMVARSKTYEGFLTGLVACEQPYSGFKRRLIASLPRIALDMASGLLRSKKEA